MKIAIHAGTLRGFGSAAVGRAILESLCNIPGHDLCVWYPQEWNQKWADHCQPDLVRPTTPGLKSKFRLELWDIPRRAASHGCEALLSLTDTSCPHPGLPHVLFVQQAFLAYPSASFEGFPGSFRAKMRLMARYFALGRRGVSKFVVQTQSMRSQLIQRWRLPEDRVEIIPSSVDAATLAHRASAPRELPEVPSACYISGAGPHKNHEILPAVLSQASNAKLQLRVTLNRGDCPGFDAEVRRHSLTDRVHYVGYLDRQALLKVLGTSTLAIIPSRLESFGLGYYEALCLGLPIVSADIPVARDACGDAALYAAPDDARAFAAKVDTILASAAAYAELSEACSRRFESQYVAWDDVGQRFLRLIESLL